MKQEDIYKCKRGTIIMSRNSTTGFIFIGVVLGTPDRYGMADTQFVSSYDGLQKWSQKAALEYAEIIGEMPDWAEWNTCDVSKR